LLCTPLTCENALPHALPGRVSGTPAGPRHTSSSAADGVRNVRRWRYDTNTARCAGFSTPISTKIAFSIQLIPAPGYKGDGAREAVEMSSSRFRPPVIARRAALEQELGLSLYQLPNLDSERLR
jgi:hypothetical protein